MEIRSFIGNGLSGGGGGVKSRVWVIEFDCGVDVGALAADIANRQHLAARQLALHVETPLRNVGLEVGVVEPIGADAAD